MSADHYAQEELAHIGRMIAKLERIAESERRAPTRNPVMRREYWMRRINAVNGRGDGERAAAARCGGAARAPRARVRRCFRTCHGGRERANTGDWQ